MDARSLPPLTGTHRRISHSLLVAFVVAGGVWLAAPASAQTTNLHGAVGTSNGPTTQQTFTNVPYASISGLMADDGFGNKANAGGDLATPEGQIKLQSHACSGGRAGWGGLANGSSNADVYMDYLITSATLPAGTPVSVRVEWAESASVMAVGEDMAGVSTGANAAATSQVVIYLNYFPVENRSGTYSSRDNVPDGYSHGPSGTLNPAADSSNHVYTVPVGQVVTVSMSGYASSASSVETGTTDGDVQFSMVWGVSSEDPNASVVLTSDHSQAAPPAGTATYDVADAIRPPRPIDLLPCFRIATQPVEDSTTCASGTATFTVVPMDLGPFTYQWRKDGVAIDTEEFPSAAEATLTLMNISTDDAGSYDVIITNPCGDITSDAAALTVCASSIGGEHPPQIPRLTATPSGPFHATTTLAFDLATAGVVQLEVFDVQGARVRTLASGWLDAGHREVVWRGEDDAGHLVPSGAYFVRLQADGVIGMQRIVAFP